ncbi:MAG: GNAT family N-acetyltransferase [Acidimicrobiia bacterium]
MFKVRRYAESDAIRVGVLIADTYGGFNLRAMTPAKRESMLGPFALAGSSMPEDQEAIAVAISAPSVWVAEDEGEVVGVLRGGRTDHRGRTVLSSLFVDGQRHRQGIGRTLVAWFEQEYATRGVDVFKLSATLYAVPFYLRMGYRKSTGVRTMASLGESGLAYQPMKKTLPQQG